jgi:hypothetical protein
MLFYKYYIMYIIYYYLNIHIPHHISEIGYMYVIVDTIQNCYRQYSLQLLIVYR